MARRNKKPAADFTRVAPKIISEQVTASGHSIHINPLVGKEICTMSDEVKIGDVVRLKSGGPEMTVWAVEGDQVQCAWFIPGNERELKTITFHRDTLEKLPSAETSRKGQ